MLSFRDKTYCASPNCNNECGRKMTDIEKYELSQSEFYVSYAYFCHYPDMNDKKEEQSNA